MDIMTLDLFTKLLVDSRLSSRREAQQLLADFQEQSGSDSERVDKFCDFLIATGRFTPWQCSKLCAGKWKGFYLDNYLVLEPIGQDNELGHFIKARDARDGRLVRLTLTPREKNTGPEIEYKVDDYLE